ncbi:MAG: hypothetical protein AAF065_12160 [Verrucomicrobiota bacterium]
MPKELIDSVLELIDSVLAYEFGTTQFYIAMGACLLAWLVVARILMRLFRSGKGVTSALLALMFPLFFGLTAYGLTDWKLVAFVESEWAEEYLALGAFGGVSFLTILITARRLFDLGFFSSFLIIIFASASSVGAYFTLGIAQDTFEKGKQQIKQREQANQETMEKLRLISAGNTQKSETVAE